MNLGSVRYCENYIYIGLRETDQEKLTLNMVRNVYVKYTITIHQQVVDEIVLLKGKDILSGSKENFLKVGLDKFIYPEDAEISINSIKINREDKQKDVSNPNTKFDLVEIQVTPRSLDELLGYEPKQTISKKKLFTSTNSVKEAEKRPVRKIILPPFHEKVIKKIIIPESKYNSVLERVEETPEEKKTVGAILSQVESKIEEKLSTHMNKINMDLNDLAFASIDLLLTSLPKPETREDFKHSKAMIDSIHKYIRNDLMGRGDSE